MSRTCPDCGAPWLEGITPASPGWCTAECDLVRPGVVVESTAWNGVLWTQPELLGRGYRANYHSAQRPGLIPVAVNAYVPECSSGWAVASLSREHVCKRVWWVSKHSVDSPPGSARSAMDRAPGHPIKSIIPVVVAGEYNPMSLRYDKAAYDLRFVDGSNISFERVHLAVDSDGGNP